jgi:hypothetical protein
VREKVWATIRPGTRGGPGGSAPRHPPLWSRRRRSGGADDAEYRSIYRRPRDCAPGAQFVSVGGGSWRLGGAETPDPSRSASGSSPLPRTPKTSSSRFRPTTNRGVASSALNDGGRSVDRDSSSAPARLCRSGTIRDGRRRSLTVAILENAGFSRPGVGFKSPLSHFGYGADGSNSSILPMTGCIPRSRALARVCCHRST